MINLNEQYPNKTAGVTENYPFGQARNVTLPGDRKGTPWDQALVNDLIGFQQAAMKKANMVPSGTPDNANTSQVLDAIIKIILSNFSGGVNYFRIPNFLEKAKPFIVQWGLSGNIGDEATLPITFNISFPNNCFNVQLTENKMSTNQAAAAHVAATEVTKNGFNLRYNSSQSTSTLAFWYAVGN